MKIYHLLAGAMLLAGGCYTPPPGGALVEERSFTPPAPTGDLKLVRDRSTLTLEEARRIALVNNPSYRSAGYAIEAARMRYYQSLGAYSPVLSAAFALGSQLYDGHGSLGNESLSGTHNTFYTFTTVQANWLLFDGLAREFTLLASRHGVILEEKLEENAARVLLQAVSYAYFDIIAARARIGIAEADAAFQQAQLHAATLKFRSGDISRSDVLNFSGKLNQARMNTVKAHNQLELAFHSLALLLGYAEGTLPTDLKLDSAEPDGTAPELLPVDFYLDSALARRPDLAAYREALKMQEYALYSSYGSFSPTVSGFANYSYSSNSTSNSGNNPTGFGNFYEQGNSFNYGMLAELTIFNGFSRYNRTRELRAQLDGAFLTGSEFWMKTVREVRDAHANRRNAAELCTIARSTRDIMREERDLVAREYGVGEVDLVRLDSAQDQYVESENTLLELEMSLRRARVALESASGLNFTDVSGPDSAVK